MPDKNLTEEEVVEMLEAYLDYGLEEHPESELCHVFTQAISSIKELQGMRERCDEEKINKIIYNVTNKKYHVSGLAHSICEYIRNG